MVTPFSVIRKVRYDYLPRARSLAVRALIPRRAVRSRGLKFTLSCENWITAYRWRCFNEKEPETLDWIDQYVRNEGVFLDIGANVGVYSIYAALRYPNLKVIAFEPEYSNLHLLKDNILANSLENRVSIYSIALGNENGISHLHIQDATPGAALHTVSRSNLDVTYEGKKVIWKEGVATMALDHFLREAGLKANFIKIDVDGNEKEILEGACQTLSLPDLKSVLIEISDKEEMGIDCKKILEDARFKNVFSEDRNWNYVWNRA